MTYSIHQRRTLQRKYGRRPPPAPQGDPNGDFFGGVFISWDELEYSCREVMRSANARIVEQELGKMDWRKDPTYNLRRKR